MTRLGNLPVSFDMIDGVLHVTVESDVVVRYKGQNIELMAKDHSVAIGGAETVFAGGSVSYQPYDDYEIMKTYSGRVSDRTLETMIKIAQGREMSEIANRKAMARKQFYWNAAQKRKFNQMRRKGNCSCG